jgi:NifU-like protein involved in Fe-S cluster formation
VDQISGFKGESERMRNFRHAAGVNRFAVRVKCAMLPVATALEALNTHEASGQAKVVGKKGIQVTKGAEARESAGNR